MSDAYSSRSGARLHVVMRNEARGCVVFSAALAMQARPIDRRHLAAALARHPWMTATVLGGIYWRAIRNRGQSYRRYAERVPAFFPRPPAHPAVEHGR